MADSKKLTLPSSTEQVYRLESFVDSLQRWVGFNDDVYSQIMMALSEAVTNAIVHGNKEDEKKTVYVVARRLNEKLSISVKDEGDGFDPNAIPDPLKQENLLKEGGRGVFLMNQFADGVDFSENGSKLTLTFNL